MKEEGRGSFRGLMDSVYSRYDRFVTNSSGSYSEELNSRADALGDGSEHTLAYYEGLKTDPMAGLSQSDMADIERWMTASESLPDTVEEEVSASDQKLIDRWMERSENLDVDMTEPVGFLSRISAAWNSMFEARYERKLREFESRRMRRNKGR